MQRTAAGWKCHVEANGKVSSKTLKKLKIGRKILEKLEN